MSYLDQLRDLIELTQAGADPMSTLGQFHSLEDERRQRIQSRKQAAMDAQQDALDFLQTQAFSAAGEPSSLEDVSRLTSAYGAFANQAPQDALSTLFNKSGQSRIGAATDLWDTSPLLDVADRRHIIDDVHRGVAAGKPINQIRSEIHARSQTAYPADYDDIQDSIDMLIQKALGG